MPGKAVSRALLIVVFAACAFGDPGAAPAGEVVFRTQVKNLGLAANHLDRGRHFDETVEVALPGRYREEPHALPAVARTEASNATPLDAVQADFSAWKADEADWIHANFAAEDQAALARFLANEEARAAMRAGFALYDRVFVWGRVMHGDYALMLITYGQGEEALRGFVATLIEEDGAWKRTNALSTDETLDVVWTAFRLGDVTTRP